MNLKPYLKSIFIYFLFCAASFFVVFFYGNSLVKEAVTHSEARSLYKEANNIATSYASRFYNNETTLKELYTQISAFSDYLDADIQVISPTGKILADSEKGFSGDTEEMTIISDFNPTQESGSYYQIGTFYGTFRSDQLNVLSPITVSYKVRGYIAIHKPVTKLNSSVDRYINIVYKVFIATMALAFVILVFHLVFVDHRLEVIRRTTKQYANHDFGSRLKVRSTSSTLGQMCVSINSMGQELNTLEDDQRKFISNISHDFRSPLTSIQGYVNAILDGTIPPELQDKYLKIVIFETQRLDKLTQNILDLNKFAGGSMILDQTDFDINSVIRQTALSFEGVGKQKGLTIDLILTGETMIVHADKDKIQQVLYNLIDNAIKFSRNDSVVTVETTERNGKLYVSVRDNGIGIPKDSLGRIWERFYKTDQSRGRDKKGSGLGLAIVKEIISAHGENISVISTENVGTEFTFTLSQVSGN